MAMLKGFMFGALYDWNRDGCVNAPADEPALAAIQSARGDSVAFNGWRAAQGLCQ